MDTELVQDKHSYSGGRSLYYSHDTSPHVGHVASQINAAHETLTERTPDTSFYQWVPFVLVFQVKKEIMISGKCFKFRRRLYFTFHVSFGKAMRED